MPFTVPGSGDLREPVSLVARTSTPNAAGGLDEAYATILEVWARVRQPFGVLEVEGRQTTEVATHVFTVRAGGVPDDLRYLEWDGRRYRVQRILRQGLAREWLELQCEELGDAN
jgi:head-tail adaptor